jgi:putative membrane protein
VNVEIAMKYILLLSTAALFASASAFAAPPDQPGHKSPAPGTNSETMSNVEDATSHAVGTMSAATTSSLQGFVTGAAISDMYEVEAGKIAEQRSSNPDVKAFAQKMVQAHTATTAQLKSILASMKNQPAAPAHLDDRRQGLIDNLRGASAADFDARYMSQQVDAHKEALSLMKGYAKDGDNPSVKSFAAETAPKVQDHLSMAEPLYKKLSK